MSIGVIVLMLYGGYYLVTTPSVLKGPAAPGYMTPAGGRRVEVTKTGGGGGGGTYIPPTTRGGGTVTSRNVYPVISRASIPDPAGRNQSITYASSGKAAISHRVDVPFQKPNVEATVFLAWPAGCSGGGHPELALKFMGPSHTDSSCCYLYSSFVPQGGTLQIGRGGEGPHPQTTTLQQVYARIPFQTGKLYGCKGVVWAHPGGGAHHESWYNAGGGWVKAGQSDVNQWGKTRTASVISPNAQVEFRIDCSNVTYSGTDVAEIAPPKVAAAGYLSYAAGIGRKRIFKHGKTWNGTQPPPSYPIHDDIEDEL